MLKSEINKLNKLCKQKEIDTAYIDSTLTFEENLTQLFNSNEIETEKDVLDEEKEFIESQNKRKTEYVENLLIDKQRKGNAKDIMEEIKRYAPHTERLTISTLMAVSLGVNVINLSEAGHSKSYCSTELLEMLEIPFTEISGHYAPMKFYKKLQEHSEGLIVIDESAGLLSDREILNMLLSALWGRVVFWNEESFKFNGTILFNTNHIQNTPFMRALSDRVQFNRIKLNSNQIKDKIKSKDYKPDKHIWSIIKNNLGHKCKLTNEDHDKLNEILDYIKIDSVRDSIRLNRIAQFSKNLLGDMSMIPYFYRIDRVKMVINSGLKRSEKVREIAELRHCSERQARNIICKSE